jgi:hypothetical protein
MEELSDMSNDQSPWITEAIRIAHCARCLCRTPHDADRVELVSRGAGFILAICGECFSELTDEWPMAPVDPSELWDRAEGGGLAGGDDDDWW